MIIVVLVGMILASSLHIRYSTLVSGRAQFLLVVPVEKKEITLKYTEVKGSDEGYS